MFDSSDFQDWSQEFSVPHVNLQPEQEVSGGDGNCGYEVSSHYTSPNRRNDQAGMPKSNVKKLAKLGATGLPSATLVWFLLATPILAAKHSEFRLVLLQTGNYSHQCGACQSKASILEVRQ